MGTHLIQAPSLPTAPYKYLRTIDTLVVLALEGSEVDNSFDKPPVVIDKESEVASEAVDHLFCRPSVRRVRDSGLDILANGE